MGWVYSNCVVIPIILFMKCTLIFNLISFASDNLGTARMNGLGRLKLRSYSNNLVHEIHYDLQFNFICIDNLGTARMNGLGRLKVQSYSNNLVHFRPTARRRKEIFPDFPSCPEGVRAS